MIPDDAREQLRDELAHWPIGNGYYSTDVSSDEAVQMADGVLNLIRPWVEEAEQRAKKAEAQVQRVRDLADQYATCAVPASVAELLPVFQDVGASIIRALDGEE